MSNRYGIPDDEVFFVKEFSKQLLDEEYDPFDGDEDDEEVVDMWREEE